MGFFFENNTTIFWTEVYTIIGEATCIDDQQLTGAPQSATINSWLPLKLFKSVKLIIQDCKIRLNSISRFYTEELPCVHRCLRCLGMEDDWHGWRGKTMMELSIGLSVALSNCAATNRLP